MSFEWPAALLALLIVPVVAGAYVLVQRARPRYAARFTNLDLLANVVRETPQWRRHVPPALFCLALAALAVALARPHATLAVPRERAAIMLVTDVSGSMKAEDVAPDRLSAAQGAGLRLAETLPDEVRLGLVTFSQAAAVQVPLTTQREPLADALAGLEAEGGTAMGDGLATAIDALEGVARGREEGKPPPAAIVLLSDGENTVGLRQPLDAAQRAAELGIPIYAVALGTDEGEIRQIPPGGFLPQTIPVPPDRETLAQIAEITGGRAFQALDAQRLDKIYQRLGSRIATERQRREVTAGFAASGILLLLGGGGLSLLWFGRLP
ncbi:MAG TPA: VWA domain-containing protein [Solirubrobacteraceae bacterium]|nr:VWA domain-containing protein [Solirubrobacteraceae bacterium]